MKRLSLGLVAKIALCVVAALVLFFGGYQLAVYQQANNDTLFPHIRVTQQGHLICGLDNCGDPTCHDCVTPDEPVIYLYPTQKEAVHVQVGYAPGFSSTVPSYGQNGWTVEAQPSGQLTNPSDGKVYPYLIWEGNPTSEYKFDLTKGFVVPGAQTESFLRATLPQMGLSSAEINAFVTYWLPRMHANAYNLIHFAGTEYTKHTPLTISPQPDSILRVFMAYKPLQHPITVTPQTFTGFDRKGFTVVEWGGTEL